MHEYGQQRAASTASGSARQDEPILTAALPTEAATEQFQRQEKPMRPVATLTPRPTQFSPDTTQKKAAPLILNTKPDPATTAVNIVGGVMTAAGLGIMIASASADTGGEWGGLGDFLGGLMGFILAMAGVALLFFQGKNGRRRRLKEERKAARKAVVARASGDVPVERIAPPLDQPAPTPEPVSSRKKTGITLIVIAGVLALLSVLPFVILLLPIALILLIVWLAFLLAGD